VAQLLRLPGEMWIRWVNRDEPMACPSTRLCPGEPRERFARWSLAREVLHCSCCGKPALALHWRTEGLLQAGKFPRV
jgi:hypothetical protein